MRQAGYLAAAGIYAMDHHIDRLADDHKNALQLSDVLAKKDFIIYTTDGFLKITWLQFPGKKKMQAHELLNGITFTENAVAQ